MPIFEYQAVDGSGTPVRGSVVGASLGAVADELAKRGLVVSRLDAVAGPEEAGGSITATRSVVQTQILGPLVGQVALSQLLFFFRQLATMLSAGVGIVQSLDTLAGQSRDPKLQSIVRETSQHVREGRPISAGLERYPEVFSPLMISLLRAGEKGGILDASLTQIAEYLEREIELRNLIKRVTLYPKLVIGASIFIIIVTNIILGAIGSESRLSSPLTNPATWVVLGPLLVGLFIFFRVGTQNPNFRPKYDEFLLRIPGIGITVHQLAMAKFSRAMAALYKGGVPIPDAVKLSADACGSEYLRRQIYGATGAIQEGYGIGETFARTGAFSPIVLDMVRTGETTGNLDLMLNKVGEFYEGEAQTRSVQTAHLLGVTCLLIVGIYVAYMVITFYAGYFGGIMGGGGA